MWSGNDRRHRYDDVHYPDHDEEHDTFAWRAERERARREFENGRYADVRPPRAESFAGKGPKGWRRTDELISDDINLELTCHPGIDATDVEVDVRDGIVTLSGAVPDRSHRRLVEEVAEQIFGVRDVQNLLRLPHDAQADALPPKKEGRGRKAPSAPVNLAAPATDVSGVPNPDHTPGGSPAVTSSGTKRIT